MKQKTKKISWENFKDEIKVISAGQQKLLTEVDVLAASVAQVMGIAV